MAEAVTVDHQLNWRKLQQLGLNAYEARSYVVLIGHSRFKALELAARAHVPRQKIYEVLDSLVEKGFAQVFQEKTKVFSAVDPTLAIPGHLAKRSKALQAEIAQQALFASGLIDELRPAYHKGQGDATPLDFLSLVNDPTQIAVHYGRMLAAAHTQYDEFAREPFIIDPLVAGVQQKAIAGVRCRLLFDHDARTTIASDALNECSRAGVDVRFVPRLPIKLALFDAQCGLLGLPDPVLTNPCCTALIFEHEGFAEAMSGLFQSYWERATCWR